MSFFSHTKRTQDKANTDTSKRQNASQTGNNANPSTLKRFRAPAEEKGWSSTTKEERRFYQSSAWRTFRQAQMDRQRLLDIDRSWKLVQDGICSAQDHAAWLLTGKPLCEISYRAGLLVAANVLDHIIPMNQGGARWATSNLQWLSDQEHNRKSARDRRNK